MRLFSRNAAIGNKPKLELSTYYLPSVIGSLVGTLATFMDGRYSTPTFLFLSVLFGLITWLILFNQLVEQPLPLYLLGRWDDNYQFSNRDVYLLLSFIAYIKQLVGLLPLNLLTNTLIASLFAFTLNKLY